MRQVPLQVLLEKKPVPCLRSGLCCRLALCDEGVRVHGARPGPCPSLREDPASGQHACGLVVEATSGERERLVRSLYIGEGCCASLGNVARSEAARRLRRYAVGDPCYLMVGIAHVYATVEEVDEAGAVLRVRYGEGEGDVVDLRTRRDVLFEEGEPGPPTPVGT